MSLLRKIVFAMTASAALLAAPATALASTAPSSTAPPAATAAFTPAGPAVAAPNPHCTLSITLPRLVHRRAEVSATIRCRSTVTAERLVVGLFRNGVLVARAVGHQARGRGFTVTASRACRNHNRGSFTGAAIGQLRYRGHLFTASVGPTRAVTLACGF